MLTGRLSRKVRKQLMGLPSHTWGSSMPRKDRGLLTLLSSLLKLRSENFSALQSHLEVT